MSGTKPGYRPAIARLVIERAPSHDDTPTVAAYHELDNPDDWRTKVCQLIRLLFAFRIYDTTPDAADVNNIYHVARVIFEETLEARSAGRDCDVPDRIEVIGLPMSPDTTDHERALKCREFETVEITARKNSGSRDWYLRRHFENGEYSSSIHVISRLCQGWEQAFNHASSQGLYMSDPAAGRSDPFGTFFIVAWDFTEDPWVEEDAEEVVPPPEMTVSTLKLSLLPRHLAVERERIDWFYIEHVRHGGLDAELELGELPPDQLINPT